MKTAHRWLPSIFCFAMLVSCATTYIPTDSSVGNMSVNDARKEIVSGLSFNDPDLAINVRITTNKLILTINGRSGTSRYVTTFSELTQISGYTQGGMYRVNLSDGNEFIVWKRTDMSVVRVANAFYVLKQNAIKTKKDADEYESFFAASLADYRKKAAANTALPEEANKYKVQAEGAVRDKEFNDAADYYAAALKIAPWWPVGHFNRALVLGEAGDYDMATREMKYYLQLVPGAPNARAAQDKIYDWARLDSK